MAIDTDNLPINANIFAPEFITEKIQNNTKKTLKKRRKNKRLNTLDSEYLPDEAEETENENKQENIDNFFIENKKNSLAENLKKAIEHFISSTPLINYFFMKERKTKIEKTVETLAGINQNVDELMNTAVPYGEAAKVYRDIAYNLTTAANIIGKTSNKL
jgi:6-pyruvoyl-tetrahydropterin synthase